MVIPSKGNDSPSETTQQRGENMTQEQKIKAAVEITKAIACAIKDLGSVPSGHLYARLMGHLSLENFQGAIGTLKRLGLVEEKNHLLTYVGK